MLCDDQPVLRYGLRTVLEAEPDIAVVCEVGDGRHVVRETRAHQPDVLVLDPQLHGFAGIEEVREAAPTVAVLVFTGQDLDATLCAAVRAGARGYLLKDADNTEIVRAVRCVAVGSLVFDSRVSARLSRLLTSPTPAVGAAMFARLTTREHQVLDLMASGASNSVISNRLRIASKTISNHISAIFAKLQVSSRAEAIVLAREAGLGLVASTNPSPGQFFGHPVRLRSAPGRDSPAPRIATAQERERAAETGPEVGDLADEWRRCGSG
jgi:DNA-binding NarL/FixJ family response regulator